MTELTITKEAATKAFANADEKGKKMLADLFGEKTLYTDIKDRVKTLLDAIEIVGCDAETRALLSYQGNDRFMIGASAFAKLCIIRNALNMQEDGTTWNPDWSNNSQYKYYPYFEYKSGFGFSLTTCDYWCACTCAGSRLCFKSRELAEYAGKQFEAIYNDFLTL